MNKKDLIKKVSRESGYDRKCVEAVAEGLLSSIRGSVAAGEAVYLSGFGVFERKHRSAKTARNIRAGIPLRIPEHDIPHFRPCGRFKEEIK